MISPKNDEELESPGIHQGAKIRKFIHITNKMNTDAYPALNQFFSNSL
jgi:hypothetical protein